MCELLCFIILLWIAAECIEVVVTWVGSVFKFIGSVLSAVYSFCKLPPKQVDMANNYQECENYRLNWLRTVGKGE